MYRIIDRLRAARSDQRGFTLIELLVVIIILGVLAAVVVFSIRGITNDSDSAACETEVRTVETAIEAYYAENDAYPGTVEDLVDANLLRDEPGASNITNATTIDGDGDMSPAPACP